jgi:deoxyinosine 3'endonuclease (endonuclease V)
METGRRPGCGVCAAVDVHYLSTGGALGGSRAGRRCRLHPRAGRTHRGGPRVAPYRPGEFYLRELPPLRAVLEDPSGLSLLVVDGYADLDPAGRPGLGAHAHAEFGIPVIGVAKSRFRTPPTRYWSCADPRHARCSSPRPGCPRPTRPAWSGAWPAGTGCPTHCAAPILTRTGPPAATMTDRQPR